METTALVLDQDKYQAELRATKDQFGNDIERKKSLNIVKEVEVETEVKKKKSDKNQAMNDLLNFKFGEQINTEDKELKSQAPVVS